MGLFILFHFIMIQKAIITAVASCLTIASLQAQDTLLHWAKKNYTVSSESKQAVTGIQHQCLQVATTKAGRYTYTVQLANAVTGLDKYRKIIIPVANTSSTPCLAGVSFQDKKWLAASVAVQPGQTDTLEILFFHNQQAEKPVLVNMEGHPDGAAYISDPVQPAMLNRLTIELRTTAPANMQFGNIIATGEYIPEKQLLAGGNFFPFIDQYGQYRHGQWPGKTTADTDLHNDYLHENEQMNMATAPVDFDAYGGWKNGPQLAVTGHFRVQKWNNRWWMVDPAGKLFWSHGINCVGFGSGVTPLTGRENYFSPLPPDTGIYQAMYSHKSDKSNFNFYTGNLLKKYGSEWKAMATAQIHKRLSSWGVNTIGNWSDPSVYSDTINKHPYTANVGYGFASVYDDKNYYFPDVFAAGYDSTVKAAAQHAATDTRNDSWCIGYFVDNELKLDSITFRMCTHKKASATKQAFISFLKKKYQGTNARPWEYLHDSNSFTIQILNDMLAFDSIIMNRYYTTCRDAVHQAAAGKMYLGNRFNLYRIFYPDVTVVSQALRIAARYCDIVSINYYRYMCNDLLLPDGIDKPIIIGEFHFGALDRGLPHTGLRNVMNQQQRKNMYLSYLTNGLKNPQIVGIHWFQYADEPYTGRFDGENYQIGFVDICDKPYEETIEGVRSIGYGMYRIRANQ